MAKKKQRPNNDGNSGNGSKGGRDSQNGALDATVGLPMDSAMDMPNSGTAIPGEPTSQAPVDEDTDSEVLQPAEEAGPMATVVIGIHAPDFDSLIVASGQWGEGDSPIAATQQLMVERTQILAGAGPAIRPGSGSASRKPGSGKPGSGSGLRDSDYARAEVGDFHIGAGSGSGPGSSGRHDKTIRTGGKSKFELAQMLPERRVKLPAISSEDRQARPIQSDDDRDDVDYVVTRFLGQGTNGIVYEATQSTLRRPVAIKAFKTPRLIQGKDAPGDLGAGSHRSAKESGLSPAQLQRSISQFLYEASITSRLTHPNIIPVFDLGTTEDGDYFYAMKKMEERPWTPRIRNANQSAKDLEANVERFRAVCEAMAFSHQQGIIHRDLKPDNVVLGDFNEVTVVDWGLAVDLNEGDYGFEAGGTAPYMAPEMAHHFLATRRLRGLSRLDDLFDSDPVAWSASTCLEFSLLMGAVASRLGLAIQNLVDRPGPDRADVVYKIVQAALAPMLEKFSSDDRYSEVRSCLKQEQDKQNRSVLRWAKQITQKSDIYVLGAILFEIATGQPPHAAPPDVRNSRERENISFEMSTKGRFAQLTGKVDPLRRTLGQIAIRAMQQEPDKRFASVEKLLEALNEFRGQLKSYELAEQGRQGLGKAKAGKGYDHLLVAMEAFREAGQVWSENKDATVGQDAAAELYATRAYEAKDFDAGLSILTTYHRGSSDKAKANATRLRQNLERGRRNRSRLRAAAVVGWGIALVGLPIVIGSSFLARYALISQNAALEKEKVDLEKEKSSLTEEKSALTAEKSTLESEKLTLSSEKITLTNEKTQLLSEKTSLEADKAMLTKDKEQLQGEKESLQMDKETLTNEKEGLEGERLQLLAEKSALETEQVKLLEDTNKAKEIAKKAAEDAQKVVVESKTSVATKGLDADLGLFASDLTILGESLARNDAKADWQNATPIFNGFETTLLSARAKDRSKELTNLSGFTPQHTLPANASGGMVLLGTENGELLARVFNSATDKSPRSVVLNAGGGWPDAVAVSPDGNLLAIAFDISSGSEKSSPALKIVDLRTNAETVLPSRGAPVASMEFCHFLPADSNWQLVTVEELAGEERTESRLQLVRRTIGKDGTVLATSEPEELGLGSDKNLGSVDYHVAVVQGEQGSRLAVLAEQSDLAYKYTVRDLNMTPSEENAQVFDVQLPMEPRALGLATNFDGANGIHQLLCGVDRSVLQITVGESQYRNTGLTMREPVSSISSTASLDQPLFVVDGTGLVSQCFFRGQWEVTRVIRGLRATDDSRIGVAWNQAQPNSLLTVDGVGEDARILEHDLSVRPEKLSGLVPFGNATEKVEAFARDAALGSSAFAMGTSRGELLYSENASDATIGNSFKRIPAPTPTLSRSFRSLDGVTWVPNWGDGYLVFYGTDGSLQLLRQGDSMAVKFPGAQSFGRYQKPRLECAVDGGDLVVVGNHPTNPAHLMLWRFGLAQQQVTMQGQVEEISFSSQVRRFALAPTGRHLAVIRETEAETGGVVASRSLKLEVAALEKIYANQADAWKDLLPYYQANDPFVGFTADGQTVSTNPRVLLDKFDMQPKTVVDTWSLVNSAFEPGDRLILTKGESWSVVDWGRLMSDQTLVFALAKGRRYFASTALKGDAGSDELKPESALPDLTSKEINRRISIVEDQLVMLDKGGDKLNISSLTTGQPSGAEAFEFQTATDIRRCGTDLLVLDGEGIHVIKNLKERTLLLPRNVSCLDFQLGGKHIVATYNNGRTYVFRRSNGAFETQPIAEIDGQLKHPQLSPDGRWLAQVTEAGEVQLWDLNDSAQSIESLKDVATACWLSGPEDEASQLLVGRVAATDLAWDLWDSNAQRLVAQDARPEWLGGLPTKLPVNAKIADARMFTQLSPSKDFLSLIVWRDGARSDLFVASCVPGESDRWLRDSSEAADEFTLAAIFPNPTQVTFSDVRDLPKGQHSSRLAVVTGQESRSLSYLAMFVEDVEIEVGVPIVAGDADDENQPAAAEPQPPIQIRRQKIADWSSLVDREINPRHAGFTSDGRTLIQCQESRLTILQATPE